MQKERVLGVGLFLALFIFAGCGGKSGDQNNGGENKAAGDGFSKYNVISGEIENQNGHLVGSGQIVFKQSLGRTDAQKNFQLTFSLEEKSSLTLHAFASRQLQSGLDFKFQRHLKAVSIEINGIDIKNDQAVESDGTLSLSIDIHNNEGPDAHIIIENSSGEIFNSGSGGWSQGGDKFWGLTLEQVSISDASVGGAKHDH